MGPVRRTPPVPAVPAVPAVRAVRAVRAVGVVVVVVLVLVPALVLVGGRGVPGGAAVRAGRAANASGADVAGWMALDGGDPLQGKRVVLMGDSVMASLHGALVAAAPGSVTGEERSGCGWLPAVMVHTLFPELNRMCLGSREAYLDRIAASARSADAVVLLSTWENNDFVVGDQVLELGTPAWDVWFMDRLEDLRVRLGTKLVLTTIPLNAPADDRTTGGLVETQDEADQADLDHVALVMRIYAAQHSSDVVVVDLNRIVCPERFPCPRSIDGVVLRPGTGGHYDPAGAAWTAPRYLTAVGDALVAQEWLLQPWPETPPTPGSVLPSVP